MTNFGWCVWLVPHKDHEWNSLTNDFPAHMTVQSHLSESQARILVDKIKFIPNEIELVGGQVCDKHDGFNSIFYKVKYQSYWWWPENAHVSFRYSYGSDFYPELYNDVEPKKALIERAVVMDCSGHFSKWRVE